MADLNDVSTVIASALEEVSVKGALDVQIGDEKKVLPLEGNGEELIVKVVVERVDEGTGRASEDEVEYGPGLCQTNMAGPRCRC